MDKLGSWVCLGLGGSYLQSLHGSSFLGLPSAILTIRLAKQKRGTTMETIGGCGVVTGRSQQSFFLFCLGGLDL